MFKTLSLTAVHLLNSSDFDVSLFLSCDGAGTADSAGLRPYSKKISPKLCQMCLHSTPG